MLLSIFVNSIVEILGLAVVVPVIGLVVQPETIQTNPTLKSAFDVVAPFGINTPSRFLIALCGLMIGAFLFKAVFGLLVNLYQTRFSFSVAHRLSGQMWSYHFSQSLERMRGTDSGRILSQINVWPLQFANAFMVGGLMIVNEICVISLIAVGLLGYNPIVFLSIAFLIGLGALIIRRGTKKRLIAYSDIRRRIEPQTNTLVTNAVRGFLEVITFRASDAVRAAYLKDLWTIFRIASNTSVLNLTPAKLYEVLAVVAVAGSIIIALLQGTPDSGFLELLSFMAISAYRIMPSMSRINRSVMQIRGQQHVLDTMERGYTNRSKTQNRITPATEHITTVDVHINHATLSYEALDDPVLDQFNHSFSHSKVHAVIGPSGSGKSTLISALLGLHKPEQGTIEVQLNSQKTNTLGDDLNLHEWILHVGYLSQQPFLFQGTVRDNLTLRVPSAVLKEDLVISLIEKLKLDDCLGSNPLEFELQEGGNNLSGGQQQRLALLRALQVHRPVLILDEATSALDTELREVVFDLLQERAADGCNVILVTHDKELAKRGDDILDLGAPSNGLPS
jgi:ABC-type multidrug transport system fused ATPase/permease subunit